MNDNDGNIRESADFILNKMQGRILSVQLLSFMFLGEEKYRSLGMHYPMQDLTFDREAFQERVRQIAAYFNSRNIPCTVGNKK